MGHDESLLVLSEGVRIVARFVRSDGAAGAAALASTDWQRFERWLADLLEHVTLVALQRRYGLSGVELRLVLAALAGHGVPGRDSREVTFDRAAPAALTLGQAVARLSLDARERAAAERTLSPDGRLVACGIVALGRDPAAGIASTQPLRLTTPAVRFLLEQPGLGPAVAALARWEVPDVPMERVVLPEDTRQKALALARAPARYRALVATWGMEGILPAQGGLVLVVSGAAGSGKTLLRARWRRRARRRSSRSTRPTCRRRRPPAGSRRCSARSSPRPRCATRSCSSRAPRISSARPTRGAAPRCARSRPSRAWPS
ncbi:MAG: hypothetical protein U1F43_27885 [Myxococcota bacterium]